MSHIRDVIFDAVGARLATGSTAAASRVLLDPADPRTVFPAITLVIAGEDQRTPTFPYGAERTVERELLIDITGEVQQIGDYRAARSTLMAQIEALMAQPITGVRNVEPRGYAPDTQPGEMTLAVGRQRYALTYITTAADPSTAI